ncbi:hypothetical protein QBC47DRAFT_402774 [Echria macrotheca]|uniref:WD40 repeat-like protein n=1 Tax=Echria macrotheca TaxID=438768 RepID=A0AAJ0B9U8_9PEZI|nr:hypothetical protein QBC47DRAFT_402774 [Echria macrotheca]
MEFDTPFPRLRRRRRQVYSSPSCLSSSPTKSPADSGYGSGPASSSSPDGSADDADHGFEGSPGMFLDGNDSDIENVDDPFFGGGGLPTQPRNQPQRQKPATLPIRSTPSRPGLPSSFFSETDIKLPRASSDTGLRDLDRFIPARSNTDATQKFRTGKSPSELTPSEKLLRHSGDSEDAFCYRRRAISPAVTSYSVLIGDDPSPGSMRVGSVLGPLDHNTRRTSRQVSRGTVWSVGGVVPGLAAVDNGRGQFVQSGTNARLFRTPYPKNKPKAEEEREKHEARIALALGMDQAHRVLETKATRRPEINKRERATTWNGTEWVKEDSETPSVSAPKARELPHAAFKVLDAPGLKDDFYCTLLAYSATCGVLAVGLGDVVYGWSEAGGVRLLNASAARPMMSEMECHLTCLAFSSTEGRKGILAHGRRDGTLTLMSLLDDSTDLDEEDSNVPPLPRFEIYHNVAPLMCLSWKPTVTPRPSGNPVCSGRIVYNEDLLVGDELGFIYYYGIEWPERWEVERDNWPGKITMYARITVHSQQICGLAWSRDGSLFATGGNDNVCCLFETSKVIETRRRRIDRGTEIITRERARTISETEVSSHSMYFAINSTPVKEIERGDETHRWFHEAAVKAIAFCPWQDGLVATGGGSNDKCIHFFHTTSGAPLATISVSAQVTSLIWSTTSKEIAATFGYAHPEHPVRIAVFSWPDCHQVAAIPWPGEHRALYAIPYPGGPKDMRGKAGKGRSYSKAPMEGCIIVASSDMSIKFHEVWATDRKGAARGPGMLCGSEILEGLEGIDRDAEVIR